MVVLQIPSYSDVIDHEVELGLVIGKTGNKITESEAMSHVSGYLLALDMTDMGEIRRAMKEGLPFCVGKGFDTSTPVSSLLTKEDIPDPHNVDLWLKVNGEVKQQGNTKDLILTIPALVSYISEYFTLEEGDMILTGTPAGNGPVRDGDIIECGIGDRVKMTFPVTK